MTDIIFSCIDGKDAACSQVMRCIYTHQLNQVVLVAMIIYRDTNQNNENSHIWMALGACWGFIIGSVKHHVLCNRKY